MEINFRTRKLSRTFSSDREIKKVYGDAIAGTIRQRLAVLRKAPSLTSVPTGLPERRHRLSSDREGQYAVYLTHPYRLIFEPYHDPIPLRDDGGVDTDRVTSILIIEVVDYHGR